MSSESLSREAMVTLKETLARKYISQDEARQFVAKVDLDPIRIAFQPRADLTWFSILEEARNRGDRLVRAVIAQALRESPEDEVLRRLRDGVAVRIPDGKDIGSIRWHDRKGPPLEKVLGARSALVPVSFLEIGVRCARSVAQVRCANGSLGTGFLTTDDLLITNSHVLGDREAAAGAKVHFNYQKTVDGREAESEALSLDPEAFFVTSSADEDDCTIVKVAGDPSSRWGSLELGPASLQVDDRVNIIQHPGGQHKQLSFFHNLVTYVGEGRVQYLTDTMPGSSGSPVFDKDWRLVALHHSGGWITEPGSGKQYFRNEGVHVDRVLDLLRRGRA